ncbi:MAG: HDOD domain-containing protein, partial [Terracidiphilus sp.]
MATPTLESGSSQVSEEKSWSNVRCRTRIPIMDVHNAVRGYDVLIRGEQDGPDPAGSDAAGQAIIPSLEQFTRGLPAFLSYRPDWIAGGRGMDKLPPRTVLKLPAESEPSAALVSGCCAWKALGHGLALEYSAANAEALVSLADFILVDFAVHDAAARNERFGSRKGIAAKRVATHMETQETLREAREEGFDFFEGYFFAHCTATNGQKIPGNKLVHLEILELIQNDPYDLQRLSQLVRCDPALTFRLLRLVNSPMCAVRQEVTSIQAALLLVGQSVFRRIALVAIARDLNGDQPAEILRMALARSRFCELAASVHGLAPAEQYLIGMVSLFPAMLN